MGTGRVGPRPTCTDVVWHHRPVLGARAWRGTYIGPLAPGSFQTNSELHQTPNVGVSGKDRELISIRQGHGTASSVESVGVFDRRRWMVQIPESTGFLSWAKVD